MSLAAGPRRIAPSSELSSMLTKRSTSFVRAGRNGEFFMGSSEPEFDEKL